MKQLTTSVGTFAPYKNITTLADRYVCDGDVYFFSVVGSATIEDYVPPPPTAPAPTVPKEVPMTSGRIALLNKGWLQDVTDFLNGLQGDVGEKARIYFEYSSVIRRDNPVVAMVATAKGWTKDEIDQLFIDAAAL
jgi:hypothetical protein